MTESSVARYEKMPLCWSEGHSTINKIISLYFAEPKVLDFVVNRRKSIEKFP